MKMAAFWDIAHTRPAIAYNQARDVIVYLLQATTRSFMFFTPNIFKDNLTLVSTAALCTIATHAIVFKPYRKM
jgi:hypothetical protein